MNLPKILASIIFILIGVLVFYKGIQVTRSKGIGNSFVDILSGLAFVFIGVLIILGYIN